MQPRYAADAACREHPEVNFFPERGESSAPAKAVCAACLVNIECLTYALTERIEHGVWAGTSARQRRKIWGTP
jgi:WhiB family transcriptional regulator, redox-sensing transcriptional regulator